MRTDTGLVCLPPLLLVLLHSFDRVLRRIDTATRDNEVRSAADSRLRGLVLLTELIALGRQVHSGGEDNEILVLCGGNSCIDFAQRAGRHKTQHEFGVLASDIDRGGSVRAGREGALGCHFSEDKEPTLGTVLEGGVLSCLSQGLDDAFTGEDGAVDDVGPFRDAESALVVLLLDGVANVDEFAVFEDKEVVLSC